jgi:hypothetical protein
MENQQQINITAGSNLSEVLSGSGSESNSMQYEKKTYSSNEIESIVKSIISYALKSDVSKVRRENIDQYKQHMMAKYGEFHYNCPTLFFMIIENPSGFPMYRLQEMLQMRRKIENREVSGEDADKAMGQKYYDEFAGKYNFK